MKQPDKINADVCIKVQYQNLNQYFCLHVTTYKTTGSN
jgi:hypothetical protein